MASGSDSRTWVTYVNTKDCSQGFCSVYCPQWCYIVYAPPPPFELPNDDSSKPNFSPLVIAIIGIFASAFLLVSYYTLISKYCGNTSTNTSGRNPNLGDVEDNLAGNRNSSIHEPWQAANMGLDESLIKKITVFRYRKQDCLTEGTDCSICLGEFNEDESLRLLPKCSHAFHVSCIDRWLKSHSNCPLCRANIIFFAPSPPPTFLPPQATDLSVNHSRQNSTNNQPINGNSAVLDHVQDARRQVVRGTRMHTRNNLAPLPKSPIHAFVDLAKGDAIIEIIDDDHGRSSIRRSVSMDHFPSHGRQLLVADVLLMSQEDEEDKVHDEECGDHVGASSSTQQGYEGFRHSSCRKGALHCIMNGVAMKRSFSCGGSFLAGEETTLNEVIPR